MRRRRGVGTFKKGFIRTPGDMEVSIVECATTTELAGETFRECEWSLGSAQHHQGLCKPCTWYWKRGCNMGASCEYCHLCGDGELKARKKKKYNLMKEQFGVSRFRGLTLNSKSVDEERITMRARTSTASTATSAASTASITEPLTA